ncbi:unnamed protein product [Coffea canephora]|uniref:DH200=94 genomic scaffold, scaffold_389 n=1 Tax=Coffea canephora TaxID=49390 RepID=A0A068VEW7_COFCA|nr:unnamed protein product [Coffea canephora]
MFTCGLSPVDFDGCPFTWTNGKIWQRLDKALINARWAAAYPVTRVSHLPRGRSDHAPLLIKAGTGSPVSPSFRYLNVWHRHHTFWETDTGDIQASAVRFFSALFQSSGYVPPPTLPQELPRVSTEEDAGLRHLPDLEEIRAVVFAMDANSAPGPDGFGAGFYQQCWEIIKADLLGAVQDFFKGVQQPRGFSSALLVLIPKTEGACQTLSNSWFSILVNGQPTGFFNATVPYMAFADDTIIFTRCSEPSLTTLHEFLLLYQKHSEQKVNAGKSTLLMPARMSEEHIRLVETTLGFHRQSFPIKYLGVPLVRGRMGTTVFDPLLAKLRARLFRWSSKLLSTGGKIVLIRHVLGSIPLYLLQAIDPPKTVVVALGRICNSFLWDSSVDSKRLHWAAWEKLCFPVQEGGLGFHSFFDSAKAFASIRDFPERRIRWCLGKGLVDFWHDTWCGDLPLALVVGSPILLMPWLQSSSQLMAGTLLGLRSGCPTLWCSESLTSVSSLNRTMPWFGYHHTMGISLWPPRGRTSAKDIIHRGLIAMSGDRLCPYECLFLHGV